MAVNVFVREKVDAAILEVGIGGEYDCTNFLKELTVVGITSLALDHVELLGTTIPQIAWQKSGIMKANVPAFTVQQEAAAMHVLQKRAVEKECQLVVVPPLAEYRLSPSDPAYPQAESYRTTIALGIPGAVQQINASLAVQLSHAWLKRHSILWQERRESTAEDDATGVLHALPAEFADGLAACRWPGR